MSFLSNLSQAKKEELKLIFRPDNGSSVINEIEIDEDGRVVRIGHSCTKQGCNCVGGWWDGFESHEPTERITLKDLSE